MKIQTTRIYTKIDEAIKQGYNVISLQGSSRSSKTYNTLIWLIVYCLKHPKTRLSIVRATLPAIKGSVFVDFKEILINMGIFDDKLLNKTDFIYTFPNGSWVEFFSTSDEQKIRGRKRDVLFVNEANELRFIEWQQLKMRTTRFSIIDYNPSFGEDHWIFGLNDEDKTHHFISTYKDNPFLEQSIIDEIESLQWKNKSLWEVYGLGKQAVIEGVIFRDIHIVDSIPGVKNMYIGMDFGFSNDPTAICTVGVSGDNLYIDEICYNTNMMGKDIIQTLKSYADRKIISESADPRLIREIHNSGLNIHPVQKYSGSINAGVTKMLESNIYITRRSTNIINEFKNYTWQQSKDGKWLNVPIDGYNHSIDAIRYVVLSEVLGKNNNKNGLNKLRQMAY